MFIEVNKKVSIGDLLHGMIIQSGNDASVALAEHVAGDESTFAELMNQHAKRLGMANSHFENSTGLPHENHYTTARDLSLLTRALIKETPDYYAWHAIKEFTYNGITQHNRNKLLWRDSTVDGVKTGHTEDAGYCLVASAVREDMRLISVVMGTKSEESRANENQALLNYGYRFFKTHRLYQAGEVLNYSRIWKGAQDTIPVGLTEDLYVTIPRKHFEELDAKLTVDQLIIAPVETGKTLGSVRVTLKGEEIVNLPLKALGSVQEGSLFQRLKDEALMLLE
jgi:D-alanyl-D-alanine carboxypeptidase (penicillin-binding protein 5/6)